MITPSSYISNFFFIVCGQSFMTEKNPPSLTKDIKDGCSGVSIRDKCARCDQVYLTGKVEMWDVSSTIPDRCVPEVCQQLSDMCRWGLRTALTNLVCLEGFLWFTPHCLAVFQESEVAGLLPGCGADLEKLSTLQEKLELGIALHAWETERQRVKLTDCTVHFCKPTEQKLVLHSPFISCLLLHNFALISLGTFMKRVNAQTTSQGDNLGGMIKNHWPCSIISLHIKNKLSSTQGKDSS